MDDELIKALVLGLGIYLLARWLVADRPRWKPRVIKGGKSEAGLPKRR